MPKLDPPHLSNDPREVVLRVLQCLNDPDLDRYPALFAEDVEEQRPYQL